MKRCSLTDSRVLEKLGVPTGVCLESADPELNLSVVDITIFKELETQQLRRRGRRLEKPPPGS